jgi:hypothetical protein
MPSWLMVTTHTPSRLNAADVTGPRWLSVWRAGLPQGAGQIRALPSSLAVTSCVPAGSNATLLTAASCPASVTDGTDLIAWPNRSRIAVPSMPSALAAAR